MTKVNRNHFSQLGYSPTLSRSLWRMEVEISLIKQVLEPAVKSMTDEQLRKLAQDLGQGGEIVVTTKGGKT